MDEGTIRATYRAEGGIRRTAKALGLPEALVSVAVAPIVKEVAGLRRAENARRTRDLLVSQRRLRAVQGAQWRCPCGCLATGDTCHRGHPAPWID